MGVLKLGSYILDHDEKSFLIEAGEVKKIEYSSGENLVVVAGEDKSNLLERTHQDYIDFKFSFDELNFETTEEAVTKLEALIEDISKIEINNPKKSSWNKSFRVDEGFDDLSEHEQIERINNLVVNQYKEDTPEIKSWEKTKDGWGKDIVKVKLRRTYDRKVNLEGAIISIHTQSRDEVVNGSANYKVKPHIHIVVDKNKAFGKDFSKLKMALYREFVNHNLTSSHNVDIKQDRSSEEYKEYRVLKDRLSSFSWVLNKHEEGKYILDQLSGYKGRENSIKLNNVEDKLHRYLELGGSYDFARKIRINLKNKLNIDIALKAPERYQIADHNISHSEYSQVIKEIRYNCLNGDKISERYKEYAKEILAKDNPSMKELIVAKTIQGVVRSRGYYLDNNWNKVINTQKINSICDRAVKELNSFDCQEFRAELESKIDNREYLSQEDLRADMDKAGIEDTKGVYGLSEVAIVFQSTEKYVTDNLDKNIDPLVAYQEIKTQIECMDLNITDQWKDKITLNIYKDGYRDKAKAIIENKMARAILMNTSYNTLKQGYKQLAKKFKELTGKEENIIFKENEDLKNQAQESVAIISQLEQILKNIDEPELFNILIKDIDDKLSLHEDKVEEFNNTFDKLENEIKRLESNKQVDKEDVIGLKDEIETLKTQKEQLSQECRELESVDLKYLNDLQGCERTKNNLNIDIYRLEAKLDKENSKIFFRKDKKEMKELKNEIKAKTIEKGKYEEKIKKLKNKIQEIRKIKSGKLNKLENNIVKLKSKENKFKELLGIKTKKKYKSRGQER